MFILGLSVLSVLVYFAVIIITTPLILIWNCNCPEGLEITIVSNIGEYLEMDGDDMAGFIILVLPMAMFIWFITIPLFIFYGFVKLFTYRYNKKMERIKQLNKMMEDEKWKVPSKKDLIRRVAWCDKCEDGWNGSKFDRCPKCGSGPEDHRWIEV